MSARTNGQSTAYAPAVAEECKETFPSIPPFPSDVPIVPLLRLSLAKLLVQDEQELLRLEEASKRLGFFYLDMRGCEDGEALLRSADALFDVGERLFDPLRSGEPDGLAKFDFSTEGSYFGYKGYGKGIINKAGIPDRNEFYNVSKDDILGLVPPLPAPPLLNESAIRSLLSSFITASHGITILLLDQLNAILRLPSKTLSSFHQLHAHSGDQVRFIKAPPQPGSDSREALGAHTDFGTLTVLFNRLGGLQVLLPSVSTNGSDNWLYVKPLPGHAIVNLGDALAKFSNGLLRSNMHRVVNPPGQQAACTRYSLVYFSRPADDVLLRRLDSAVIPPLAKDEVEAPLTSKEWVLRRALVRRGVLKNVGWQGTETTKIEA